MNDSIPSTSSNASKPTPTSPPQIPRKTRRKYEKEKLPTPPPDPREDKKESCSEKEFLEYLEQLQKHTSSSRSTSHLAPALMAGDAFDHLEKLYKLMEQMLELRAQNAKLHRRIRDLEHLNNLEKMYREVENSVDDDSCPELERDTAFAETILESILQDPKQPLKPKGSLRRSLMRRHRNRSCSATDKPVGLEMDDSVDQQRRASLCIGNMKKSSKVSKWTRVKAAFKWEKASSTVGDTKSLDSGVSDIARYLRVPSNNDDGHSPSDSGAAEISTPGSLSSASSNENFHKSERRSPYEELRSSDDEHSHLYSSHSKDDPNLSPRSSQKSHRTTWAKMKDMINTRNPVRKKSRLSNHSDDIQIDIDFCSDNEDVFEDNKPQTYPNSTATSSAKLDGYSENDIPLLIRERYRSNDEQLLEVDEGDSRKVSKWTKVKRAFLPNIEANSDALMKDDTEVCSKDPIQSEINRNYRNLQKKLSIEFQEKLTEWKRIKQTAATSSNTTQSGNTSDEQSQSSPAFMKKMEEWEKIKTQPTKPKNSIQMTSEENLPPEFKKKLQEWEKIKKSSVRKSTKKLGEVPRWKSMQYPKSSDASHVEIPVISEEFKKKLEEWKQIKAAGYKSDESDKKLENKTPSPTYQRMDSRVYKTEQDRELQWYEKELNKIEKEKNRLEKERQKFMEKEEKLSKLRKSVIGSHKKDILVHTPSGFYKFEGISRKFTQKLYEWEKSRGIGPESSTFVYLNPEYPKTEIPKVKINGEDPTPTLARSRSVDSVVVSALNIGCPLTSQASSLSLNDMEEFETKCMVDSKSPSAYLHHHNLETDGEEPEALIVEVEDFVEETAAPLKNYVEQHNPVYHCEEMRPLCVCLTPKVRRSESARAQSNYSLIEETLTTLRCLSENEVEIRKVQIRGEDNGAIVIKDLCDQQQKLLVDLLEKIRKLQEENKVVVSNLNEENQDQALPHITDILDVVQDLSTELISMTEKLKTKINNRRCEKSTKQFFDELRVQEIIDEIKFKLLELRRHLSYVCAASDSTAPQKRKLCRMKSIICEKSSNDSQCTTSTQSSEANSKPNTDAMKSEVKNTQNQGAIKKRIRYRVETIRQNSLKDSDDEEVYPAEQKKYPKLMRSRTLSEGSNKSLSQNDDSEAKNLNIFPAVTKSTFPDSSIKVAATDSPVTIFVKTTRKLFTPFVERSFQDNGSDQNDVTYSERNHDNSEPLEKFEEELKEAKSNNDSQAVLGLPPLPSSPVPQKKYLRDMSPSIRLMLNKYQQKVSEQDSLNKSGGSSGSASPVAWRSPTAERRVKAQTEKYQEEIIKLSPIISKREILKSISHNQIPSAERSETKPDQLNLNSAVARQKSILKSSSLANLVRRKPNDLSISQSGTTPERFLESIPCPSNSTPIKHFSEYSISKISSELRLQKLKRAKEEFLNAGPSSAPPLEVEPEYPKKNRLSTISVESSSSAGSTSPGVLVKSISAGMINIAADVYRQFEGKPREYVSLPRNTKAQNPKKSPLSNLASKFRKVKMRKGKERDREGYAAVTELCRQSLVVDINDTPEHTPNSSNSMTNNNQQIPISKSSSWIRKSIFFKK